MTTPRIAKYLDMIDAGGGKHILSLNEKGCLFFFFLFSFFTFLADFVSFFACGTSNLQPQIKQGIKFKVEPTG